MTDHGTLIIISVYLPPKKELLRSDIETFLAVKDTVILFGNLNSKNTSWRCNYTNSNEHEMVELAENLHFDVITPPRPTYFPDNEPSSTTLRQWSRTVQGWFRQPITAKSYLRMFAYCIGIKRSLPPRESISNTRKWVLRASSATVPQGSTLSLSLYSAYVNNISRPSKGVQLALFADDTVLYVPGISYRDSTPRLQRTIELTPWLRLWRIDVNMDKLAVFRFNYGKHKKKFKVPYDARTLRIANAPIPLQYLGVMFDKHFHFRDHVMSVRNRTQFYQSHLNDMIGRQSKMSLRNKRSNVLSR
ncbi:Probable RNA-directed DNA polymerase from transposon BS [Eumeta japonica]|uniref:Probable RNA-directed DNA polymerase from transposon BS n=1 Tax=Eumeta variegata TaxID=151549 RepID=A0A4C1Y197_EUMVA|nr:Probable RNA-directed DNA polymerase from transposon BS [Eumeta japonica]